MALLWSGASVGQGQGVPVVSLEDRTLPGGQHAADGARQRDRSLFFFVDFSSFFRRGLSYCAVFLWRSR